MYDTQRKKNKKKMNYGIGIRGMQSNDIKSLIVVSIAITNSCLVLKLTSIHLLSIYMDDAFLHLLDY